MKVKKEKTKKPKERIYTPMKMTKALQELGESYNRKKAILVYVIIMLVAVVLGLMFKLDIGLIAIAVVFYALFVPRLIFNNKKQQYEKKRFEDVNAYMAQVVQSFTSNKNILASLKETRNTFPSGRMKDTLDEAVATIENAYTDVRGEEKKALGIIESKYDCERVKYMHDFLLKAEEKGGECAKQFQILECLRTVWEMAVQNYHKTIVLCRNLVAMEYALLLCVCVFILTQFPEDIAIIHLPAVKIINLIMIMIFMLLFSHLDKRLNGSLLRNAKMFSQERVAKAFSYLNEFDKKKERKKSIPLCILAVVLFALLFMLYRSAFVVAVGIVFIGVLLNLHNINYYVTRAEVVGEMKKAFPKWLFEMMLLIQSESVEGAIFESAKTAPPILQPELERVCTMLQKKPHDADAYMSFLAAYNIPGVENAMRKLYSLSVGTGGSVEVMDVIIDSNMTLLTEAEKKSMSTRSGMTSLYQYLPLIPVCIGVMVYCGALIVVIFEQIAGMI